MKTIKIHRTPPDGYYPKPYVIWILIDGKETLVQCFTSDTFGMPDINVVVPSAGFGITGVLIG